MEPEKPSIYLLRGDDNSRIKELISRFKKDLGSQDIASLNTTILDGGVASLDDIRMAALAIPFLTERRLVVIENALKRLDNKKSEEQEKFLGLLDTIPTSTALILVVDDKLVSKRGESWWEKLTSKHWLMNWIHQAGSRAWVEDCPLPSEREMTGWVIRKAREMGGNLQTDAAARLVEYIGNDTLRATQEITKLLTYVNYDRPVTSEDVSRLTSHEQEGNIFDLTDALGEKQSQKAIEQLRILLETNEPLELAGMINRQFRLLLQARELLDEHKGEAQVREELNLHPYAAQKLTEQARHFSMQQLEEIYRRLLKIDMDMKSGGTSGDLAFELLITEMTN